MTDNKLIFANNLTYYMQINRVDRYKLCDDMGFNYSTVSEWLNGKKYPRIDKIEMLADYFHIKKSDLIESHDRNKGEILLNPPASPDEYEQELIKLFHRLNVSQKAEVIVMINKLLEE